MKLPTLAWTTAATVATEAAGSLATTAAQTEPAASHDSFPSRADSPLR
jgi:hypothetical protein